MKTIIKIPRDLFEQAKGDLRRSHLFAGERVGFFSTKSSKTKGTTLVHCIAYTPADDAHYIDDETVGARINSMAITQAMSRSLVQSVGQLHVHYHGGRGLPCPSQTDLNELPPLAGSFRNANGKQSHGWVILGESDAYASLLLPGITDAVSAPSVSIVGFPIAVNRRNAPSVWEKVKLHLIGKLNKKARRSIRYARQSFLGDDSEAIIAQSVIGVVGLCGGGSHIVQQMAHLGFKNFILCDADRVAASNLNRLVGGTRADVNAKRLKTEIAERTLLRLHKDATIIAPGSVWEESVENLIGCDLIFGCVDSFLARRDLEAFCRRHLIPYIDIGMDVHEPSKGRFEINGQVILSMPGTPCMHCMGFLNETVLAQEAARYGAAGDMPQVVWPNGLLSSAAVGVAVDLLTDWSKTLREPVFLTLKGSTLSLATDNRIKALRGVSCRHYPIENAGDVVFKHL